ncbi:hypothetical protein JXK06_02215, partial [Patescibacteria group bacterium]|nr:hypothetical protein [Patescibacteria group bacterium]
VADYGFWSAAGSNVRNQCHANSTTTTTTASSVSSCLCGAGYWSQTAGSCIVAGSGYWSGINNNTRSQCAAGYYGSSTVNSSSTCNGPCSVGTYAAGTGNESCTNCPAGYCCSTGSTYSTANYDGTNYYVDADGDGYGTGSLIFSCPTTGYATNNNDCDDSNSAIGSTHSVNRYYRKTNACYTSATPNTVGCSYKTQNCTNGVWDALTTNYTSLTSCLNDMSIDTIYTRDTCSMSAGCPSETVYCSSELGWIYYGGAQVGTNPDFSCDEMPCGYGYTCNTSTGICYSS